MTKYGVALCLTLAFASAVLGGPAAGLAPVRADDLAEGVANADSPATPTDRAQMALEALREFAGGKTLGNGRRVVLVKDVVDGIHALLPKMGDPSILMTYTGQFVAKGIEPDINTLEYWGESPSLQARAKSAADAAPIMLQQVSTLAKARKLDEVSDQSEYYYNMIAYYRAIATDTSGGKNAPAVKERARICDDAIKYFQGSVDQPDTGVQPVVHARIGKLAMAKGEYAMARRYFNEIIDGRTADGKAIAPAPSISQLYEARYFALVCDVLGKRPDSAEKGLSELTAWQKKNLPDDVQKAVEAAADMLRYRMLSAKADLVKGDAEKHDLNKQADGVLAALEKSHPEFTPLINEQLASRLPESANLNEQPDAVLKVLIAWGNAERLKPDTVPLDEKVANRAVQAAQVLIARKNSLTPRELLDETLFIAILLDRENKAAQATDAHLDFARAYSSDPNAGPAIDRALTLAYQLAHGPRKDDPLVQSLYGRALSTGANPPWSRKAAIDLYAHYLRKTGKPPGDVHQAGQ